MIYIISYPHSGNTFTRYIVEYLSGRPTIDAMAEKRVSREQYPLLYEEGEPIAYKRHDFKGVKDTDNVIFVLRNYIEALVRFNRHKRPLNMDTFSIQIKNYMKLLEGYDNHKNGKTLIRYEDLISDDIPVCIARMCLILNIPVDSRIRDFIDNINEHRVNSLKCFPRSQTGGRGEINHSKHISEGMIDKIKGMIIDEYYDLYIKYLTRYD